jgi:transcriptional regulator with XRE-family HTH domain
MTQVDVAHLIGTTAATVSRLETSEMRVSVEWLKRFAHVFGVASADLIDDASATRTRIPYVGEIGRDGALKLVVPADENAVTIEAATRDPIALRIRENVGTYCAGDLIIADRLASEHTSRALGRDCVVGVEGAANGFGRFVSSVDGRYLLVPPSPGAQARPLPTPDWVAPVIMLIRYL